MHAIGVTPKNKSVRVKVANSNIIPARIEDTTSIAGGANNAFLEHFYQFWDLMDTIQVHGYLRTAMSVIGRAAVGTWWTLKEHSEWGNSANGRQRRSLYRFYTMPDRDYTHIQDFYSTAFKIMIGVMYLRYFGRAAYKILRDERGKAVGLDFLFGFVVPNTDEKGKFRDPAFVQYMSKDLRDAVEHKDAKDIVYIVNPDWRGFSAGGTDVEALTTFTLPLDIYLMTAAREYIRNHDKPEVIYTVPPDISDDAFDAFVAQIGQRWAGPKNKGKSPIVVSGEVDVKELSKLPDGLPFQETRGQTKREIEAVTGVNSGKMGEAGPAAALRELRREFHETIMTPLFRVLEQGFYDQIHLREFKAPGWVLSFNNPDFLTAVERAVVDMRYRDMGVVTANEIRASLGKKARTDPDGDAFVPTNGATKGADEYPGSPPEGRPVEPDDPSQVGEPTTTGDDPARGDNHDEDVRLMLEESSQWKRYATKRAGKSSRPFEPRFIPESTAGIIQRMLNNATTPSAVEGVFETLAQILREEQYEQN